MIYHRYIDRCLTILFILCLPVIHGTAQNTKRYIVHSNRLTIENGLISNFALCGLQDSYGFIWIGTTEGLQRYDGNDLRLFNTEQGGMQHNRIDCIAEDKDRRLWLLYTGVEGQTNAGYDLDIMDLRNDKISRYSSATGPSLPFHADSLKWMFADKDHNLFLITSGNDIWWYKGKNTFNKILNGKKRYSFFPHRSLYQASGGHVWASADSSLLHIDTSGHVHETSYPGLPDLNVFRVLPNGSCIAIARPTLLDATTSRKPTFIEITTSGSVTPAYVDFFRTTRGSKTTDYLLEYHADARTQYVVAHNPSLGLRLITDSATIQLLDTQILAQEAPLSPYFYFTDRSLTHWVGTTLGVFHFQVSPSYFTNHLTRQQVAAATAVGNQARGIWADGHGNTYVGRDGLFLIRRGYPVPERLSTIHPTLVQGDSTYIWFSAHFGNADGLYRLKLSTRTTEKIAFADHKDRELWGMYRDPSGKRYIGGRNFLGYLQQSVIKEYTPCGPDTLKGICYQFVRQTDGSVIAVTDDGLFKITGNCYSRLPVNLPGRRFHFLYPAPNNCWWFCTAGDGLICWDRITGQVKQYTIKNGLPSNVLYGLTKDRNGLFWISSSNGLIRFNPGTGAVMTFTKKDGLPENEFNRGSFFAESDRRFLFGGINGITEFNPMDIPGDNTEPFSAPLHILTLQVYDAVLGRVTDRMDALHADKSITLKPDEKFITLDVALLDYTPGMQRFDYKVEGLDATWRTTAEKTIRLDNLPYGNYILRIRGQSAEGEWSTSELKIPLFVNAPIYRKPAFIICAILAIVLLLWAGVRARLRLLTRANRRLEDTVNNRTRELRESLAQKNVLMKEIHHRVKNNLQVISGLQQMQSSRSKDPQVKAAFSESQNRVLSIAFIHHNLYQRDDREGVEMLSFVKELSDHMARIYQFPDKNIQVTLNVHPLYLDIDTAVPVGLILNELLTNSYKYAFADRDSGCIIITLRQEEKPGRYMLHYIDDGPGIPASIDWKKAESLGLKLITQLSLQLDGKLTYDTSGGSSFKLFFDNYEIRNQS